MEINVNEYLPENIYLAESNPKIDVLINYKPFESKVLSFTSMDVVIEGVDKKYSVTPEQIVLQLEISAPADLIASIDATSIIPYVNVSGLKPGTYSLQLQYKNLHRIIAKTPLTIKVTIEEST